MARPANEWPIPIYDLELRERLIACYTVPASTILRRVPAPLTPVIVNGHALCSVTQASGRELKRSGTDLDLASEFHLLEVQTPVIWQRPCSPAERGLFSLLAATDHPGLNRLLSRCSGSSEALPWLQPSMGRGKVRLSDELPWSIAEAPTRLTLKEREWPDSSILDGLERAEVLLAHPSHRFFTEAEGSGVRAVPVRDYARSTRSVTAAMPRLSRLARLLEIEPERIALDHMLLQKRVTQTVFFPSERISAMSRHKQDSAVFKRTPAFTALAA